MAQEIIEVPKPLSDQQVRFFVDNGYLVMPNMLTRDELEELKTDTIAISRGKYPNDSLKPLPDHLSDTEVLQNILCIHQPHYISPVIQKYVKHPLICGVLSQITAAHLPYWDGSVKCMQSMLFVKPPGFQGQAWHQDEVYIPTRDRSLIGAWAAIDDATIENGCLWIIPGSHRSGLLYAQREHNNPDEFDSSLESYGFDDSAEIPVEVPAGGVVFFNGYLLHRSRRNRSNIYRRVLVNHYMNAYSPLPWHVKPGETVASADRRAIVPVAGVDPYAWKGIEVPPRSVHLRTCKANASASSHASRKPENAGKSLQPESA